MQFVSTITLPSIMGLFARNFEFSGIWNHSKAMVHLCRHLWPW